MLNEANGEEIDYSRYMSAYHAHNRNRQQHRDIELIPVEHPAPIYDKLIPDEQETVTLEISDVDLPF